MGTPGDATALHAGHDTCSYIVKGRPAGPRLRLVTIGEGDVAISAILRAEILTGLQALPPSEALSLAARELLAEIVTIDWGAEVADHFAAIRHAMRRQGTPLADLDLLIAAHAISIDAILVTNNTRHFGRLAPTLVVESWVDGT